MNDIESRPAAIEYDLAQTSESTDSIEYPPAEFTIPPELVDVPHEPLDPEEPPSQEDDQHICPLCVRNIPYIYWLTLHLVWDLFLMICAVDFQLRMPPENDKFALLKNDTL